MIINRHNYEEFFLLYVDNELNQSDRAAVEQFVQQHSDLAEEMEMLKQAVLPAENIRFEEKEVLYNQAEGISLSNYEEYFLLAVDKELTQQESEEVERFVLKHPELQNEFTLLEQTRLEAEPVVFAGKEKLYKKAEKERPVIFLNWARMSAAAVIIALGFSTWFYLQREHQPSVNPVVAANDQPMKRLPEAVHQLTHDAKPGDESLASVDDKTQVQPEKLHAVKTNPGKPGKAVERKEIFVANVVKNNPPQKADVTVKDEKVAEMPVQDKKSFEEAIASARIDHNSANDLKNDSKNEKLADKMVLQQNPSVVKQVVYKEIDTQEDDEEQSVYIGSARINKNKLKGLFKKASGFLGIGNNNNDGEKTLRIAGFEIKSK